MYACDPDLTATSASARTDDINDPYLYFQTKNTGDHRRVSYIEALRSCFYWNEKTGKPSEWAESFCRSQNAEDKANDTNINRSYLDKEDTDNNSPDSIEDITNKTDLRSMKKFREEFVGLTWDEESRAYVIPKNVGSFHPRLLPNAWVDKDAEAIHKEINSVAGINSDTNIRECIDLLDDIKNTVPTHEYLKALAEANAHFNFDMNGDLTGSETPKRDAYPNVTKLTEWQHNEFGALRLPKKRGGITATYPWGFDSGPGLLTLAKEADNETSDWSEAGQRAKRVVRYLEVLEQAIDTYVGNSDVINPEHTLPWFHVEHSLATIVDHLRQYNKPVFLALPNVEASIGGTDEFANGNGNFAKFTAISKVDKALACLEKNKANGIKADVIDVMTRGGLEVAKIIDKLASFVISSCGWDENTNDPKTIGLVTIVALSTLANVKVALTKTKDEEKDEMLKDISASVDVFYTGKGAVQKFKKMLQENTAWNAYYQQTALENDKVKAFQAETAKLTNEGGESYRQQSEKLATLEATRSKALLSNDASAVASADIEIEKLRQTYTRTTRSTMPSSNKGKLRYLRAPLVGSDKILEYLRSLPSDVAPLVLLADPGTLYETPVERYDSESFATAFAPKAFNAPSHFTIDALPLSFGFKESSSKSTTQDDFYSERESDNIFSSLKSRPTTSTFMSDIFSGTSAFGRTYDMDDNRSNMSDRFRTRKALSNFDPYSPSEAPGSNNVHLHPWTVRLAYMKDRIKSPTRKFLFKAIISAPNELRTFQAPASLGQKLINIVLIRPFIEQRVSSILVLEAGPNTMLTPLGGFSLTNTKEERGILHTRMDFNTGLIKVNPGNIGMIYGCIPDSHIGGMKLDYMRDPRDFTAQNPYKPSLIAMLAPVSETEYDYPVHLTGLSTYNRNDIMLAHLRKASFCQFFEHVFDSNTLNWIEGMNETRTSHGHHVQVSLNAWKGPCGFRDYTETSHKIKWVNGTGPRGSLDMNSGNAFATHNGKATYFPVFGYSSQ
jgi:hypothetical protein